MIQDWDYDGLKLDGQHRHGVPPCFNPAHKHARPEESVEALPAFFRAIYDTARAIKRDAVIEWCPCGTAFSFHTLPYLNLSVASDPRGSFQIRSKGKTVKALHGDAVAFFGDHVELSTGRDDFASTIGIGGVIGSEFTWPPGSSERNRGALTPEREAHFAKWLRIYKAKMLSRGESLGSLCDIGFDRPEAHAIRKGQSMYYAFYAPRWEGRIELRGLGNRVYRISGYVAGSNLGTVRGPVASTTVRFGKHLLIQRRNNERVA
jgi:alpha-galactosidase